MMRAPRRASSPYAYISSTSFNPYTTWLRLRRASIQSPIRLKHHARSLHHVRSYSTIARKPITAESTVVQRIGTQSKASIMSRLLVLVRVVRLSVLVLVLRCLAMVLALALGLLLVVVWVLELVLVLTSPTSHLRRPHFARTDPAHAHLVRLPPTQIYPPTATVHRPRRASTLAAAHAPRRVHANTRRPFATWR